MFFFFNDTATTEIYTLSLHDALPIYDVEIVDYHQGEIIMSKPRTLMPPVHPGEILREDFMEPLGLSINKLADRKSTRLNSSHLVISYAVFCLKKKKSKSHPAKAVHAE